MSPRHKDWRFATRPRRPSGQGDRFAELPVVLSAFRPWPGEAQLGDEAAAQCVERTGEREDAQSLIGSLKSGVH